MVQKDTAFRIKEVVQLRKKHIDFTKDPVTITVPKSIMKGKRKSIPKYLTRETAPRIKLLIRNKEDDDLVFGTSEDPFRARDNEEHAWSALCEKIGYTERYANGRRKKNIHSMRAFTMSQILEATNDQDFAQAYGDHERYLKQYFRFPEERRIKLFKKAEPYLMIYEKPPEIVDHTDEEVELLKKKMADLEIGIEVFRKGSKDMAAKWGNAMKQRNYLIYKYNDDSYESSP